MAIAEVESESEGVRYPTRLGGSDELEELELELDGCAEPVVTSGGGDPSQGSSGVEYG